MKHIVDEPMKMHKEVQGANEYTLISGKNGWREVLDNWVATPLLFPAIAETTNCASNMNFSTSPRVVNCYPIFSRKLFIPDLFSFEIGN